MKNLLTVRELQVRDRIKLGHPNKQIADYLGISIKTVEEHRANIMEKLNETAKSDLMNKYNVTDEEREQQISADREVLQVLAWAVAYVVVMGLAIYHIADVIGW